MRANSGHYTPKQGYQILIMWAVVFAIFTATAAVAWLKETDLIFVVLPGLGAFISVIAYFIFRQLYTRLNRGLKEAEKAARRIHAVERRARAVYELAGMLSATLNYQRILEQVQSLGVLAMYDPDPDRRIVSAALLYRRNDNLLHVASGRRLTLADERKTLEGKSGILGRAIQEGKPVWGDDADNDPDLRYFVGFHKVQSVVAVPLRAGLTNYGVLVFGCYEPNIFDPETADVLSAIATQATIALQNAVLYDRIRVEQEHAAKIEKDARQKFGYDLHDGPTQKMVGIKYQLDIIQRFSRSGQTQQILQELPKIGELADKAIKEIRHMIFALRPLSLENRGLVAALDEMATKLKDTYDLNVAIQAQQDIERFLEDKAQETLFYIIQEAVNNARKHAKAAQIMVRLQKRGRECIVEVEDNGVGFDVAEVVGSNYDQRGSLGMVSMRERAELIDGELLLQSRKGVGTKITIKVPVSDISLPDRKLVTPQKQEEPRLSLAETRFAISSPTDGEKKDAQDGWNNVLDANTRPNRPLRRSP